MKILKAESFLGVITILLAIFLLNANMNSLFAAEIKPRYGGSLRFSTLSDGASIGYPPKMLRSMYGIPQVTPAIEILFRIDKTGKPAPWLATGYTNNVAAKAVTLTLRKGIRFHDGTEFNAEAVKWNLDQSISAKAPGIEKFKSIDIIDDYTVRINLTEWDNTVINNFTMTLGLMISPTAYKKNGEQWCASHPVGTGPFEFVSWEKDARTVFKKFDGYWQKGKPYLDRIEWIPIADTLTRQLSFRKGELDIISQPAPKDVEAFKKDGYLLNQARIGSGAAGLVPDSINPNSPFSNLKVRQAAQYAIDNEALAQRIYYDQADPANQWIYKGHWGYNPSVVGYPYNPAKAKQLLAEAGYPNGFKTKILYRTTPEWDQIFTAVQGYLQAIGIDAQLDPVLSPRYDQIAWGGGKWDGLIANATSPSLDVAAVLAQWYTGGGRFYTQMSVPDDYLRAIQNAITAPDFETKQKYTQEAMKLMIDKYCLQIVLICRRTCSVSQTYLHNHGISENDTTLWTPEEAWNER